MTSGDGRQPLWRAVLTVVAAGLLGLGVLGILIFGRGEEAFTGGPAGDPGATSAPRWAPAAEVPVLATDPGVGISGLIDLDWAARVAAETGIPERAVVAYAGAAVVKARAIPECGLSWATLAGIGGAESDHGRHDGSALAADGTAVPPIFGVALTGGATAEIPDSDGGAIDGDAVHDRAVGPLQLIPETWRNWHIDGNGDGVEDPQNIDDATLAAANYLCRASTALDTEAGWRAAVAAYNGAPSYLDRVATLAVRYAEAVGP